MVDVPYVPFVHRGTSTTSNNLIKFNFLKKQWILVAKVKPYVAFVHCGLPFASNNLIKFNFLKKPWILVAKVKPYVAFVHCGLPFASNNLIKFNFLAEDLDSCRDWRSLCTVCTLRNPNRFQ